LDAALRVKGIAIAPRKQNNEARDHTEDSFRKRAKIMHLSKIGEIGRAIDLFYLAASYGIKVEQKSFFSEKKLWEIMVKSLDENRCVVLPYACANDNGEPAWQKSETPGFAHWCLVFGYAVGISRSETLRRVFMTTYGKYNEVSPFRLYWGNRQLQDWPRQTWIKVTFWIKKPKETEWRFWKNEWLNEKNFLTDIKEYATSVLNAGYDFAIGKERTNLFKLIVSGQRTNTLTAAMVQEAKIRPADLPAVKYSLTLANECVVV
jgi:hypothetical protein